MTASYSKKQLEDIEAEILAAAQQKEYAKAAMIADHAALALELECGSETQSARLRQIANRYGVRSGQ